MFLEPKAPEKPRILGFELRRMLGGDSARVVGHRDSYRALSE
jgi:hypothetical protein